MRIGPLEIALIFAVIIAVTIIARIYGPYRDKADRQTGDGKRRVWHFFNRTGIVLVIAGILALIIAAALFRLILQSYLWALLAIAVGFILIRLSRRKR